MSKYMVEDSNFAGKIQNLDVNRCLPNFVGLQIPPLRRLIHMTLMPKSHCKEEAIRCREITK